MRTRPDPSGGGEACETSRGSTKTAALTRVMASNLDSQRVKWTAAPRSALWRHNRARDGGLHMNCCRSRSNEGWAAALAPLAHLRCLWPKTGAKTLPPRVPPSAAACRSLRPALGDLWRKHALTHAASSAHAHGAASRGPVGTKPPLAPQFAPQQLALQLPVNYAFFHVRVPLLATSPFSHLPHHPHRWLCRARRRLMSEGRDL
jgi:hypothetical protein